MNGVLVIARREVRARRFLLAGAATLSALAMILLFVPTPAWMGRRGEALTMTLVMGFLPVVALTVGSSLIGRDLALGRLSFYFSRPLSAWSLWAGKFLGGATLVVGAFLLSFIPATVALGGTDPWAAGFMLMAFLGLMALAHVIGTMFRSWSRLAVFDLCLGALFVALSVSQVRHLASAGAGRVLAQAIPMALALATIAMLAAAAAQLAYGRADAERGHLALSMAIWAFAFGSLGALSLWGAWLLRVTPVDVGGVGHPLIAAPQGSAFFFKGSSSQGRGGFSPVFLMDGRTGSYVRFAPERMSEPAFAADGGTAVWVKHAVPGWWYLAPYAPSNAYGEAGPWGTAASSYRDDGLAVARLDGPAPLVATRALRLPERVSTVLAVDASGRQALLAGRSVVFLVEAASGELVARLPVSGVIAADFRPDGSVRLYQGHAALLVEDWSPRDGSRVERATVPGNPRAFLLLARRGDLAVVATGPRGRALIDTAGGAVRWFDSDTADIPGAAIVLSSGLVALSLGGEVRVVTRGGQTVATFPVEPRTRVSGLLEPAPGELAVGLWSLSENRRRTVFLDAGTGAVRRQEEGLLPVAGPEAGEAGSLASRLFLDRDGALVGLEADGRRRAIVAGQE